MEPDTLGIHAINGDSMISLNEPRIPVLITEEEPGSNRYPKMEFIDKSVSTEWILYISIAILISFAWVNIIYTRFTGKLFNSCFNFQLSQKVYKGPNQVQKRVSNFFGLVYYLSGGIFLFLILDFFDLSFFNYKTFQTYLIYSGFLLSLSILRILLYKGTALFFNQNKIFNEALFHNFLYNKILGIVFVPFNLLIAYTLDVTQLMVVVISLITVFGIFILRIIRALIFINKTPVSFFYFILYLCTLEILPVWVIIKLILLLAEVS